MGGKGVLCSGRDGTTRGNLWTPNSDIDLQLRQGGVAVRSQRCVMHHLAAMLGNFYHLRLRTGECTVSSWEVSGVMNERALPGGGGRRMWRVLFTGAVSQTTSPCRLSPPASMGLSVASTGPFELHVPWCAGPTPQPAIFSTVISPFFHYPPSLATPTSFFTLFNLYRLRAGRSFNSRPGPTLSTTIMRSP